MLTHLRIGKPTNIGVRMHNNRLWASKIFNVLVICGNGVNGMVNADFFTNFVCRQRVGDLGIFRLEAEIAVFIIQSVGTASVVLLSIPPESEIVQRSHFFGIISKFLCKI